MEECDLLVIIQSCSRYRERRDVCRKTWLSHCPPNVRYFFAIGGGERDSVAEIKVDEPDVVILPCRDAYQSLHVKTREMLRYAVTKYKFNHMLKCDDDTYVVLDRAVEMAKDAVFLSDYGQYVTGGGGYFIRYQELRLLLDAWAEKFEYTWGTAEDIMVYDTMMTLGVPKSSTERIQRYQTLFVPAADNDQVTTHYVDAVSADIIEHLLYSPIVAKGQVVGAGEGKIGETQDLNRIYFFLRGNKLLFLVNGLAKLRGWCSMMGGNKLSLHCEFDGGASIRVLQHIRDGFWEEIEFGKLGIVTPIYPDVLEATLGG